MSPQPTLAKLFSIVFISVLFNHSLFGQNCLVGDITTTNSSNLTTVSPNDEITYTAPVTATTLCTRKWTVTNGLIILSSGLGATSVPNATAVNVRWDNVNAKGTLKLEISDCGAINSDCNGAVKTIEPFIKYVGDIGQIKLNGTPISNYSLNCGTSSVTISVDAIATGNPSNAAVTYNWSLPSGWSQIGGGGNSITVSPSSGGGGSISVSAKRNDVSTITRNASANISRPVPTTPTLSTSKLTLCSGSGTLTASASNATNYIWSASSGISASSPGNTSSATISGTTNGTVTVQAYSSVCNVTSLASAPTSIVGTAPTSGITIKDDFGQNAPNNMSCGYGLTLNAFHPDAQTYSWSYSGNIGSAYVSDYGNGKLYFNSYNNDCYGLTANVSNCIGTGTSGITICINDCSSGFASYAVYPNPAKETVYLQYDKSSKATPDLVQLIDESTQKVVLEKPGSRNSDNAMSLNVSSLPRGRYVLRVTQKNDKEKPQTNHRIVLE